MDRPLAIALPIVLGILVVGGLLALSPGIAADTPPILLDEEPDDDNAPISPTGLNTTERLVHDAPDQRTEMTSVQTDASRSTALGFEGLVSEYEMNLLEERLEAETAPSERLVHLDREMEALDEEIDSLDLAERTAYRQFAAGEIDADQFLTELAYIHGQATILEERMAHLGDTALRVGAPSIQDEVLLIRGLVSGHVHELSTLEGPIKHDALTVLQGGVGAHEQTMVQASSSGYVLATTDGDRFIRETVLHSNQNRTAESQFDDEFDARTRAESYYPWIYSESITRDGTLRGGIYQGHIEHTHGSTTITLDGGSGLPYREIHDLDLLTMPTAMANETVTDDIVVQVNRTFAGGPAAVTVLDANTTEPIPDARVQIDEHPSLETNAEGTTWVITPGESFTVTVTTEETTVELPVSLPVGEEP